MNSESTKSGIDGGVRQMVAHWVITGDIVLETAAHFGGETYNNVDMAVLRDPLTGCPLLPGTSLAGALRGHLSDVLGGYRSKSESGDVASLFGAARSSEEGSQSPLIVFDSYGKLPEDATFEIRDGVSIEPALGIAEAHKKFDIEVLPAGTVFNFRLDLIVDDPDKENKLINLLNIALEGLEKGDISFGMRRSRGYGAIRATHWRAKKYDLSTKGGWMEWLLSDPKEPLDKEGDEKESPWDALLAAYSALKKEKIEDKRNRLVARVELSFPRGILVRSPGVGLDAPDAVHLHSGGKAILPGTSLAGVLRNRALRIAKIVFNDKEKAEDYVGEIFGMAGKDKSDAEIDSKDNKASKLRVSESIITDGEEIRQSRIRIDRFSQGVLNGALFDEEPFYGGRASVRFELRDPSDDEIGLFLLLLKDLLLGDLNVGGAGSIGRGVPVAIGAAEVLFPTGEKVTIGNDLKVDGKYQDLINDKIEKLHKRG